MLNYRKGKNVEEELTRNDIQIENLPEDFLWMHVKGGTAIPNVTEFAKKALQSGEHRTIVWSGFGGGVGKTISSAEIMKREFPLHQVTRLCYKTNEEYWEPLVDGLEQLVVKRNIPCVHILLSLDEIDPKTPGYQFSKSKTAFWIEQGPPTRPSTSQQISGRNTNNSDNTRLPSIEPTNKSRKPKKGGKRIKSKGKNVSMDID